MLGDSLQRLLNYLTTVSFCDPHTVDLPPHGTLGIPELGSPLKGFRCADCTYLTPNKKMWQSHISQSQHNGSGGANRYVVQLQTFSRGSYARYWVVGDESDQGAEMVEGVGDSFQQMLGEYQITYDAKRTQRRDIADNPQGSENQSMWVREMGWAEYFNGKHKREIFLASLMPRREGIRTPVQRRNDVTLGEVDMVLFRMVGVVDRIMQRCAARLKLVPHETLRWLNSIDPTKPAGRPFTLKKNEKSMYRYRQFIKRCLVYSVRTARLGRDQALQQHHAQWTEAQWTLLEQINGELVRLGPVDIEISSEQLAEEEAELEQRVFRYLIAILQQKVAFSVYVNPLLHFAAVLGINDVLGSWVEPKHYTASLAGLVWCGRMMMLEEVFHDSPEDPNEVTVDMVEQFKTQQQLWLADGTHSPFSTMIRWMAYGKGFRTKEGGMAKVLWQDGGDVMRYVGQPIVVTHFVDSANVIVVDAEAVLEQLVFGSWSELRDMVDLSRIVDSLIYNGPDTSFATDVRNRWLQPGFAFLAARARSSMWQKDGGWKSKKVVQYFRRLKEFRRLLIVLIHIWAGQPGRGPELTKLKHCSTAQVPGNVFVFDGQVMLITDLDKSRSIRGLGRKVARFLPRRIGQMVVAYIAWLLPFEEMLYDKAGMPGVDVSLSSYMWKDPRTGPWETEQLSDALASLTGEYLGLELMVSDYRHVAIGMARKIKGILIRHAEIEMTEGNNGGDDGEGTGEGKDVQKYEYIWDAQATHGSVIAAGHYAVDSRFPHQLQPEKIALFRNISGFWHRFLEGGGTHASVARALDGSRKRKQKQIAGSSSHEVAVKVEVRESKRRQLLLTGSHPPAKLDIQSALQQLLGVGATWKIPEQGQAVEAILELKRRQTLTVVLPTGAGKSILFMLPTLLEEWGTNVVVVPFAALIDDLIDRARQLGIDCIRWHSAHLQDREQPTRAARLVVVSADVTNIDQFVEYVDSLRDRQLLTRIFFDEAHTAVLDVTFRKALEKLKGLHRYECPIVALTATLPQVMERYFRQVMLMEDAPIIRASTVKRNIRYTLTRLESQNGQKGRAAIQAEVIKTVLRMEKTMSGDQKGVIYCRSHDATLKLSEALGCDFYHSALDKEVRQERLTRWIEGKGTIRWLVATTGLGTGIDIKGIVAVIHMEQPYGMVDFIQQTGRGGRRDGEVIESVIVMEAKKVRIDEHRSDVEHFNHQAMEAFVESSICRRVMIGTFMDVGLVEQTMNCEQLQAEMCDRCRAKHTRGLEDEERGDIENDEDGEHVAREDVEDVEDVDSVEDAAEEEEEDSVDEDEGEDDEDEGEDDEGEEDSDSTSADEVDASCSNRLNEYVKEKHARLSEWRRWLSEVKDYCPVCYVQWVRDGRTQAWWKNTEHEIQKCPRMDYAKFKRWWTGLDFGEFDCCWRCALPQSMCRGLQDRENGSQGFS